MFKKAVFFLLMFVIALLANATCKNYIDDKHHDSRYSVDSNDNGTVTDNQTELMWKICSQGQTWDSNNTCTDTASTYNWQGALTQGDSETFASYSNWRLPNIKELISIAAYNCYSPSINEIIFPDTPSGNFWSSSPSIETGNNNNLSWKVDFSTGKPDDNARSINYRVRLVRSIN